MYRNFTFNQTAMGAGMFTDADNAWYDTFYKMIGTDESLHAAMLTVYNWSGPKPGDHAALAAAGHDQGEHTFKVQYED